MQKIKRIILLTGIGVSVVFICLFFVNFDSNQEKKTSSADVWDVQIHQNLLNFKDSFVKSDQDTIDILPDYIIKRQKWEFFLANHPYKNTPRLTNEEWKDVPKTDRPDLAAQLDFFKTVDPALGYVPYQRLRKASDKMWEMINEKAAISGVAWTERGPNNVGGRSRAVMFDPNDGTNKKVWAGGVSGGLWYTNDITAASPTWVNVDDFWSNLAISCIAYDPSNTQVFYVGTGEGFFNADAVQGQGIWKTTDGGSTWSQLSATDPGGAPGSDFYYINDIAVSSTGTVYAATRGRYGNTGGILRSTDGGNTWTKVLAPYSGIGVAKNTNMYDFGVDIEIAQNDDVYASCGLFGGEGNIYRSTDGGNSWTDITGTPGSTRIELAIAPSTGTTTSTTTIYAVAEGGSGNNDIGWFKKSTNGGATWTDISIPRLVDDGTTHFTRAQAWYDLILKVHPTNPNLVIAGGIDLHRTTNGGSSWSGISHWYGGYGEPYVHADQHAIEFRPGHLNEIIVGNDGGIHYSTDAGNSSSNPTFTDKNSGLNITQFYACATKNEINSHYFLAGAQDNGTQQFTQPGINSTTEVTGGDGAFCHIDALNSNIQISSYVYNNIYLSQDGGQSFSQIVSQNTGHFINPSDYDSQRKVLYSAANNDQILRLTNLDGSPSGAYLSTPFGTAQASAFKVSPYNDVVFIGVENGRVYKLSNASTSSPTLTRIDNGIAPITTSGWVSSIDVGANDNQLLITYSNYGVISVWETTDGGTHWYNKEGNLPDMPIRWAIYNPNDRNKVLCATELGVWSTDNFQPGTSNSPTYGPSNIGLANTRCDMLKLRPVDNIVIVATHGRGLFTTDIFATTPVADFIATPKISCNGSLDVQFTDASIKPNGSWAWDIDNNGTVDYTTQNPSHTYNSVGLYSVKLVIDGGNDSITKNDLILVMNSAPQACTSCSFLGNSNPNNPYGIGISYFELGDISKSTSHNDVEYSDFTCSDFTNLNLNTMYNVGVTTGTLNNEAVKVYIDYNNDGSLDASEEIASFPPSTAGYRTASFTTPSSGVTMNTGLRMRVVSRYNSLPTSPCNTGSYGQAEDYTVYFYDASTLPIELLSFEVKCSDKGSILSWKTASEQNNLQFDVERSMNLRDWVLIGSVSGAGNSNEIREYTYVDKEGNGALYYYRLKQMDFDGSYSYSPLATSDCIDFDGLSSLSVQPNPVENTLHINLTSALNEGALVYIQDMFGKLVLKQSAELIRGENNLVYDVSFLNPGTYILVVQTEKGGIQKATLIKE